MGKKEGKTKLTNKAEKVKSKARVHKKTPVAAPAAWGLASGPSMEVASSSSSSSSSEDRLGTFRNYEIKNHGSIIGRKMWSTMFPIKGFLSPVTRISNIGSGGAPIDVPVIHRQGPKMGKQMYRQCGGFPGKTGKIPEHIFREIEKRNKKQ